jgi:hypothetical protein
MMSHTHKHARAWGDAIYESACRSLCTELCTATEMPAPGFLVGATPRLFLLVLTT